MKLATLLQQVYHEPALITPEAHASIRALLEARLGLDGAVQGVETRAPGQGVCGEEVQVEQMQIIDGIAHIPINGAIGQKLDPFSRGEGAVDVLDVAEEIALAEADGAVKAILFEFDSPGGMVSGTPELARRIGAIRKPNVSFTNGMIASAAYWLASATDRIYATPTSNIGSIGVYIPVVDTTGWYQARGVKVELIKAGRLKGIGFPGVPLGDAAREHLQERVNQIYEMFTGAVVANRRRPIASETMQGQTFLGAESLQRGLIDGLVADKADVVNLLRSGIY